MHTPAAWEEVSRGAEGRQPEMKYLLQHIEQGSLGGGEAMPVLREMEKGRGRELTFTEPLPVICQTQCLNGCLFSFALHKAALS
jgi:hypothetical protein